MTRPIAHAAVTQHFGSAIPPDERIPVGFDAIEAIGQAWTRACADAETRAGDLGMAILDSLLDLRLGELVHSCFRPVVFTAARDALAPLAGTSTQEDLERAPAVFVGGSPIERVARELTAATRSRFRRDQRVRAARTSLMRLLPDFRGRLVTRLAKHLDSLVATLVTHELAARVERLAATRVRFTELVEGDDDRLQVALDATIIARDGTDAGHFFSRPPSAPVLLDYARHRKPELLGSGCIPNPTLWTAFGTWLSERRHDAVADGPIPAEKALRDYLRELAASVFQPDLTLRDLYAGAGHPLEINRWLQMAQPRVRTGPEAEPARWTAVEAPVDLAADPGWRALPAHEVKPGADPRRICLVTFAHGHSLSEVIRGDFIPVDGHVVRLMADRAASPFFQEAIVDKLPSLLPNQPEVPRGESPAPDDDQGPPPVTSGQVFRVEAGG